MKTAMRLALGVGLLVSFASLASAQPCEVPDNGTGTVDLPPAGCGYLSPSDVHEIIDGLPPGTTIRLDPIHSRFFNELVIPGGPLGGATETFDSFIDFEVTGTGDLATFNRLLTIQVQCETATAPRSPGNAVQDFDTEMVSMTGSLVGDPDFQSLTITGGSTVGPSPGHTTLTRLGPPGSDFQVDSFFDIAYRIDYVGAPGSVLAGLSGSSMDQIHMSLPATTTPVASRPLGLFAMAAVLALVAATILVRRRRSVMA
jgi:hypothetical protein